MNLVDLTLISIIIFGGYKGYKKGFFISLIGFCSLYISLIVAFKCYYIGMPFIKKIPINFDETSLIVISIFATFLLAYLLIFQVSKFIKYILDLTLIGFLDDIGGAFLGSLVVGFITSFLFNVIDWLNIELFKDEISNSILYPLIKEIQPIMTKYVFIFIELSPDLWDMLENIEKSTNF